jgi:MtaA/CmuA family methyltransferase
MCNGCQRLMGMMTGQAIDHLPLMPITMMFAADQIGVPYGKYATDYRVMVEAQLRTAERFDLDFVSGISDPAREAADCGATVRYFDDQPPAIDETCARLAHVASLLQLEIPDPLGGGRMHDRVKAVELFRRRVGGQLLIEGWVEGPCAEAADLRGINTLMMDFLDDPAFVHDVFAFCVEMAIRFAKAQVDAGADIIGIGDAAASLVGPAIYEEFVWPKEKRLVQAIHQIGAKVRLHICGNTTPLLAMLGSLGSDIVDLDYPASVAAARKAMGPAKVLLGNIDPVRIVRNGTPQSIIAALQQCHQQAGPHYVVGAGCEVPRDTNPANMLAMTSYAKSHGPHDLPKGN